MLKRTESRDGRTKLTFSLPLDAPPGEVSVVGSFNGWEPGRHQLQPRKNGYRSVSVTLPAGSHRFRYLATGGIWLDDDHADAVDEHGCLITI